MLEQGARDPQAVGDGQWWRLVTSMFLQDGGVVGTVFNLVTLGVTVLLVAALARGWVLPTLFLLGGLVCNVLTIVTLGQWGAGNSMATMVLLVTVALWSATRNAGADAVRLLLVATAAGVLVALHDQHGLAVSVGLVLGIVTIRLRRYTLAASSTT